MRWTICINVKSVTSLAGTIPEGIPEKIIPKSATSLLHTDNYSRIMIYVKTSDESDFAFQCTNEITSIVRSYYPGGLLYNGSDPFHAGYQINYYGGLQFRQPVVNPRRGIGGSDIV